MIDSRLRASARLGGAGTFFEFCLPIHRTGSPVLGRRQSSCLRERVAAIPVVYLNTLIFMGNAQLKAYAQGGFTPAPVTPDAVNPEQVLRHHRSQRRGGKEGPARSPPSSYPRFLFQGLVPL
jgi:hypothetical protein